MDIDFVYTNVSLFLNSKYIEIIDQIWKDIPRIEMGISEITSPILVMIIMIDSKTKAVLGSCGVGRLEEDSYASLIIQFWIHKGVRGKGLSNILLKQAMKVRYPYGDVTELRIYTDLFVKPLVKIIQKNGFEEFYRTKHIYSEKEKEDWQSIGYKIPLDFEQLDVDLATKDMLDSLVWDRYRN